MKAANATAAVVGVLFLVAMVASLVGGGMIETVIGEGDDLTNLSGNATLLAGIVLEFVNAVAVVAIGFLLFSTLRRESEGLALGYVSFRIIESVFLVVAAILPLSLIALARQGMAAGATGASGVEGLGGLVVSVRADATGVLIPLFFGLGALLLYTLLYRSSLVPRFISVWGIVGVVLMGLMNVLQVGTTVAIVMVAPLILNEIFLGVWLIVRGFDADSGAAGSTEPAPFGAYGGGGGI